jgi:hypothetical protein
LNNNAGFYAFKSVAELVNQIKGGFQPAALIIGQVYLWGRVVECQFGYRAQYAYPKALLVENGHTKAILERVWSIPIEVGDIQQLFNQAITERNT